jgi:hypothetical protein
MDTRKCGRYVEAAGPMTSGRKGSRGRSWTVAPVGGRGGGGGGEEERISFFCYQYLSM